MLIYILLKILAIDKLVKVGNISGSLATNERSAEKNFYNKSFQLLIFHLKDEHTYLN